MGEGVLPGEGQGQVAAQPGDENGEGEQEVVADLLHEGVDRPGYGGGGPQSGRRGEGVDPSQGGGGTGGVGITERIRRRQPPSGVGSQVSDPGKPNHGGGLIHFFSCGWGSTKDNCGEQSDFPG